MSKRTATQPAPEFVPFTNAAGETFDVADLGYAWLVRCLGHEIRGCTHVMLSSKRTGVCFRDGVKLAETEWEINPEPVRGYCITCGAIRNGVLPESAVQA